MFFIMSRKPKVTFEQKLSAVKDYLEGRKNQLELAKKYHVHHSTVKEWICRYQSMGKSGYLEFLTMIYTIPFHAFRNWSTLYSRLTVSWVGAAGSFTIT